MSSDLNKQNFSNHVRVHPMYHYVILPVSLILAITALVNVIMNVSLANVVLLMSAILLNLIASIARDYAKKNQDRIIRAELRLRYYQLTQERMESFESLLSPAQLVSLRFASDDEFVQMASDTQLAKRTPQEIKKSIKYWNADLMRV